MYNFSGVFYRIWGVCGIMFALGIVCIVLEKLHKEKLEKEEFKIKNCKAGLCLIAVAVCFSLVYGSRILFPDVSSYTGEFIYSQRDSSVAPPLPLTDEYVFWNGEGYKFGFYLDVLSKKEIFPYEFEKSQQYTIYYDKLTKVIVYVEVVE